MYSVPTFVFPLKTREKEAFDVIGKGNLLYIFVRLFRIGSANIGFGYKRFGSDFEH